MTVVAADLTNFPHFHGGFYEHVSVSEIIVLIFSCFKGLVKPRFDSVLGRGFLKIHLEFFGFSDFCLDYTAVSSEVDLKIDSFFSIRDCLKIYGTCVVSAGFLGINNLSSRVICYLEFVAIL